MVITVPHIHFKAACICPFTRIMVLAGLPYSGNDLNDYEVVHEISYL